VSGSFETFREAMRQAGLGFAGPVVADGKLYRFKASGDRERNSWFVLHAGPPAAGAFGCWKRDLKETWCERTGRLSQTQWNEVRRRWQEAERERERAETERHTNARKLAARILSRSKPVQSHPYLECKAVQPHGEIRLRGDKLVVPLRDTSGELHSLQFISPDGTKRFLAGGRISSCFFTLADKPDEMLVLCEGYATGASVFEAAGFATVCAMNCGNLLAVAQALRAKWPEREIIIAADNDQFTDGNPGLTKAAEAAKAILAKLAVPKFKDVGSKPTDFNDVHQARGPDTVKKQIKAATLPKETDTDTFDRLAKLSSANYDRCREREAKRLKIRVATLDAEVDSRRAKKGDNALQGSKPDLADVEPWPEVVNGADVLSEVAETFGRYVALPDGAADALALWCAHAHAFKAFLCSPRLNINSPVKGCGKTTLRDVVAVLVPRPLLTENLTVAVLFRLVEAHAPTILADEYDAWLRENDELRGLLNAGHRRGGIVYRCEGDNREVRSFHVFASAVLCGIGVLPDTLHDRSIVIRLERAKSGELRERFDSRHTEREHDLCRKLARFCADNYARLESCDPALPPGVFNRLADNWRPLFAVAQIAGGDWPQRAVDAFAKLTSRDDTDAQGVGMMLLADIQQVFSEMRAERMFSKSLVGSLCSMSDRPWPEAHRGKPITETWLARRLRGFGINSRTLRIGDDRAKGYEFADFSEAFDRYLAGPGESSRDAVTMPMNIGDSEISRRDNEKFVTDGKAHETPANVDLSRCHVLKPPMGELVEADLL
jgi:putative DNA primase/helicase